jgi:predicted nucleic acid-binding protein
LQRFRHGIERLPPGSRHTRIDVWLREEVPLRFEGRVLTVDQPVAHRWGEVVGLREAAGRPIGVMDAFIAATANVHALKLVMRKRIGLRPRR